MNRTLQVAVVGAGIAGAACAHVLRRAGIRVRVFDKGRGVGGRLATRRTEDWQWDHGVQSITASDPGFARWVEGLSDWSCDEPELGKVGAPTQNQLVKGLLEDIPTQLATQVLEIFRGEQGDWSIRTSPTSVHAGFDAVVLAIPAPQSRKLIDSPAIFPELEHVRISPCWALMIATPVALQVPKTLSAPHEHVAWLAADHTKPGRPESGGHYVLHASAAWSERNLEITPDQAKTQLIEYFQAITSAPQIDYAVAHRWRYALTATPLGDSCLFDESAFIGACGDWCLGARVEHGFLSGVALAERMVGVMTGSKVGAQHAFS